MNFDLERGSSISQVQENEDVSLVRKPTNIHCEPPIYNNTESDEVILLDISCDKKWISYVTYRRQADRMSMYEMDGDKKRTHITRRRFTAANPVTGKEETVINDSERGVHETEHFSLEITDDIKNGGSHHCKFLSVSGNGKYVALSFYERNPASYSGYRDSNNPNCLVYEVCDGVFQLKHQLRCNGRAVFLSERRCSLALINKTTVEVYDNFPKNKAVSFLFDLHPFISSDKYLHEGVEDHESYIQNTSWVDIRNDEENQDMRRVITFTRHIRHNILTTPFRGGIVRVWSIVEDGVRLTSFSALNQHVMAFSKNYKYTAAYIEGTRSVNIYNVKSGLLVYQLKSRAENSKTPFEVSHIRFCYDGRYLAMSGWEENNVVFEVWYIEAEESIYRTTTTEILSTRPKSDSYSSENKLLKIVQPFVMRGLNDDNKKCLKGFYTSFNGGKLSTTFVELDIDKVSTDINIVWAKSATLTYKNTYEIENNLNKFDNLMCGHFDIDGKRYLIRFGKHTVQLWRLNDIESSGNDFISVNDDLLYIRAYKGPDYGLEYSFRETWRIRNFSSIQFIGGTPSGRMLVNITETTEENDDDRSESNTSYHTEEIFLPLDELLFPSRYQTRRKSNLQSSLVYAQSTTDAADTADTNGPKFDYHKLESACQALHYLSNIEKGSSGSNILNPIKYQVQLKCICT